MRVIFTGPCLLHMINKQPKMSYRNLIQQRYILLILHILAEKQEFLTVPNHRLLSTTLNLATKQVTLNSINQFHRTPPSPMWVKAVSYTHLRAHETRHDLVC